MRRLLAMVWLVVACGGCAGIVRTEGTSGPIAWRATDFATVTRNIGGQPVDTYEFTLIVKNVSDRTIAFTRMDRTVYQAGSGQPGHSNVEGRWELRPGVERRFPFYSYQYCDHARGCEDRGGAQPLWRIVFSGTDDQARPVESRLEVMLPPRTAPKQVQIAAATRPAPKSDLPPEGSIIAPPKPEPAATQIVARATASTLSVEAPTWQRGDSWEFRWETPTGKGVFVWAVKQEQTLDGVPVYVISADGTREIVYRKSDIAFVRETVDGTPVVVNTPPRLRYVWPLSVGRTWEQTLQEERGSPRRAGERADVVTVEAEETITVPAGTFQTLKIVCRNKDTQAIRYEEWYAPVVRHPVLLRERLAGGLRVRELTSFSVK
jgi:hypothetical protein